MVVISLVILLLLAIGFRYDLSVQCRSLGVSDFSRCISPNAFTPTLSQRLSGRFDKYLLYVSRFYRRMNPNKHNITQARKKKWSLIIVL